MITHRMKTVWMAVGLSLMITVPCGNAFARDGDRDYGRGRRHGHGREIVTVGHQRYHYQDGRFYRPGWFGFNFAVAIPPFGVTVTTLPHSYRTVVAGDGSYYYYEGVYYRACPGGYMVVPQPVISRQVVYTSPVIQPQASNAAYVTINVPNANGTFTPVTLIKQGTGYVGPQGEYYEGHPTVDQLKALYGK